MKKSLALLATLILTATAPAQTKKAEKNVAPAITTSTIKLGASGTLKGKLTVVNRTDPGQPVAEWEGKRLKIIGFPDAKKVSTGDTFNPQYEWLVGTGTGTKSDPFELHFVPPLTLDSKPGTKGVIIGAITISEIDPAFKKTVTCKWNGKDILLLEYPNAGLKAGDTIPAGLRWKALGSNAFECISEVKATK